MNRIPIALFANRIEAEPVQQRLARAGVDAEIQDELMLQKLWFVSKEAAGARLAVAAKQFEQAKNFCSRGTWRTDHLKRRFAALNVNPSG